MSFEAQSKDTIQARMKAQLEKISDKSTVEGSFSRDLINANSVEFENAYAEMDLMMDAAFAEKAWGEYLTRRCAEYGIDRKAATKAIGKATFKGIAGSEIPYGSLVEVKGGAQFKTTANTTIGSDGTGTAAIEALTAGEAGNVAAQAINNIPLSIPGAASVSNAEATADGFDEETDDALRARYYIAIRTPATSGNKYHYYNWAMAQDGVGACKVIPLWAGPGTVKVLVINSDLQSASADIIKRVADYIETVRPIGATVTVTSPAPQPVNITVAVAGTLDIAAFKKALTAFIAKENLNMKYLSTAQVGKIIMTQATVTDYDNLLINGGQRVTVGADELLTIGEVAVSGLSS